MTIQEKILLKDQMMCLKDIGSDEIQNVACKVSKKIKHIDEKRNKLEGNRKQLDMIVNPKTIAAREYRRHVKHELESKWKNQKEIIKKRVKHLEGKFSKRIAVTPDRNVPDTYKKVKISDKQLGEIEVPKKSKIHFEVLNKDLLNDEEKETIDVLPNDTFYSNITKKDGEVQTEACFAKMRWKEMRNDDDEEANEVYDKVNDTFNLSNKKATEMRSNQRVRLVEPDCDDEKEVKRDNLKVEIDKTYSQYINKHCNANPNKVLNNIKEKVVDHKIVVLPTDKTNKISVMLPTIYEEGMEEHYKDDKVITKKEVNKVERELNVHSKSVTKIFKIGLSHGQQKRALANSTVHVNGQLPVMKGAEKDHKVIENGVVKFRPIMNAMDGPKKNVSDTVSDALSTVIE